MENIINLEVVPQGIKNFGDEVFGEAKVVLKAQKIQSLMKNGENMESALHKYLPNASDEAIKEAAKNLEAGVSDFFSEMDNEGNLKQNTMLVNEQLSDMDDAERKAFLCNAICAMQAAYPDLEETAENREKLAKIKTDDNCSQEDISFLLDRLNAYLNEHSGFMARKSVDAMKSWISGLDEDVIEKLANLDADTARAYAAANYIAQQCGESVKVGDDSVGELSAYMIGHGSAAAIEHSRLMVMYAKGTITKDEIVIKLERLYNYVLANSTNILIKAVAVAAQITFGIELILWNLRWMTFLIAISPYLYVTAAVALALFTDLKLVNTKDFEDVIRQIVSLVKSLWNICEKKISAIMGQNEDAAVQNTEDAEAETETAEAADEDEEENASDEDDEDDEA